VRERTSTGTLAPPRLAEAGVVCACESGRSSNCMHDDTTMQAQTTLSTTPLGMLRNSSITSSAVTCNSATVLETVIAVLSSQLAAAESTLFVANAPHLSMTDICVSVLQLVDSCTTAQASSSLARPG
jgi:hypothetical protein